MKDETELWWSPGQINYSRQQMTEFILPNWDLFKDGIYPPRYTSYVGREQGSQKADYVDAKEIYAEVSIRLAQCPDGEMVLDRYFRDQSWGTLARNYHFPFDEDIKKYIRDQLAYICGYKRKRTEFREWLQSKERVEKFRALQGLDKAQREQYLVNQLVECLI